MKIAIIGSNSADSLESNLCESFSFNGYEASIFDIYDSRLFQPKAIALYTRTIDKWCRYFSDRYDQNVFRKLFLRVKAYSPDIVVCVYRFIHPTFVSMCKAEGAKVVHINPDALTTFELQQVFASDYDVFFTKDPYIVSFMRDNMRLNAVLYNEAFNPRLHKKPDIAKAQCEAEVAIDVMTYGTMYPYRYRMLKAVADSNINLKIYGVAPRRFYNHELDQYFQNQYITGEKKAAILYGSKIVFNQMHYAEIGSVNNRFFEANGCGAFQLSDYRPILNDLLPINPEAVSFRGIDDGIQKIKYYLQHPDERYDIADKIYHHFLTHYSYDTLIRYILNETCK